MSEENNTETQETCNYPCCKGCPCWCCVTTEDGEQHCCGIMVCREKEKAK